MECIAVTVTEPTSEIKESPHRDTGTSVTTPVIMWHKRRGHLRSKAIYEMARREAVIGLPVSDEKSSYVTLCTGCALGKFHRKPYRLSERKATNFLENVLMDSQCPT